MKNINTIIQVQAQQQREEQQRAAAEQREKREEERIFREAMRRDAELYQSAKPEKRDAIVDRMISREREYKAAGGTLPPDKSKKEIATGMVERGVLSAAQYNVRDLPKASRTVSTVGSRVQQDVARLMGDNRRPSEVVFGSAQRQYRQSVRARPQQRQAYKPASDPLFFMRTRTGSDLSNGGNQSHVRRGKNNLTDFANGLLGRGK
ncbi:MAG: hypothetical protein PHW03_09845 [Eubacteriales bacterium]|nr:hypothetical protein [Eubacteriales bacterium]